MGNIKDALEEIEYNNNFTTAEKFADTVLDDGYDYNIYVGAQREQMNNMVEQHLKFIIQNTVDVLTGGI